MRESTVQPNNNAPRRNLLFGPFDYFVMTVPAEDPNFQPYTCISKVAISTATENYKDQKPIIDGLLEGFVSLRKQPYLLTPRR